MAAAAEQAGASLYAVRQPDDLSWHVPSTRFDPAASPALEAFVVRRHRRSRCTATRAGMWTTLLVGGGNRALAGRVAVALRSTLGSGFTVVDELSAIRARSTGCTRGTR